MFLNAPDPHFKKANRSLFLSNSNCIFVWRAFSTRATSTWTEWSMTRSTGTCILTNHDNTEFFFCKDIISGYTNSIWQENFNIYKFICMHMYVRLCNLLLVRKINSRIYKHSLKDLFCLHPLLAF